MRKLRVAKNNCDFFFPEKRKKEKNKNKKNADFRGKKLPKLRLIAC